MSGDVVQAAVASCNSPVSGRLQNVVFVARHRSEVAAELLTVVVCGRQLSCEVATPGFSWTMWRAVLWTASLSMCLCVMLKGIPHVHAGKVSGPQKLVSIEACRVKELLNTTDVPSRCDYSWEHNTSFTQCCQVEAAQAVVPRHKAQNMAKPSAQATGKECCAENQCPDTTNFTINEVLSCHPRALEVHNPTAAENVTMTTYCCQTTCCHHKRQPADTKEVQGLVKKLKHVEGVNHHWLIVLSSTVAMCGFVAISFSIYMCHVHRLLPTFLSSIMKRKKSPGSSPSINIGTPPMTVVTRIVTDSDSTGAQLMHSESRTPDMYSDIETEEDRYWLLNSVVNGRKQEDFPRAGYSTGSIVYQQGERPSHYQ